MDMEEYQPKDKRKMVIHNACSTLFRMCCDSYFNHYGAVTAVDMLSTDEIEKIAYTYMQKASAEERKPRVVLHDRLKNRNKYKNNKKKKHK